MEPKKKIWIIGGSSGIGLELVKLCLRNNYLVITSSRNTSNSAVLQNLKEHYPTQLSLIDLDVSLTSDIPKKVKANIPTLKPINPLVKG